MGGLFGSQLQQGRLYDGQTLCEFLSNITEIFVKFGHIFSSKIRIFRYTTIASLCISSYKRGEPEGGHVATGEFLCNLQ